MTFITRLTLLIFFPSVLFSCSKDRKIDVRKVKIYDGTIISIDAVDTVFAGKITTVKVKFTGGNDGCAMPDHLDISESANIVTIKAFYNYPAEGPVACAMNFPTHQLTFDIKLKTIGRYIIQADNDKNIADTLTVK